MAMLQHPQVCPQSGMRPRVGTGSQGFRGFQTASQLRPMPTTREPGRSCHPHPEAQPQAPSPLWEGSTLPAPSGHFLSWHGREWQLRGRAQWVAPLHPPHPWSFLCQLAPQTPGSHSGVDRVGAAARCCGPFPQFQIRTEEGGQQQEGGVSSLKKWRAVRHRVPETPVYSQAMLHPDQNAQVNAILRDTDSHAW